jgi:hypothetical protein
MSAQRPKSILRNSYSSPNAPSPLPDVLSHLVIRKIKSVLRRLHWRFEDQIDIDQIQDIINSKDLESSRLVQNPRQFYSLGESLSSHCLIGVFGAPIRDVYAHASMPTVIGGFQHQLPIVVVACVEELYRIGVDYSSVFNLTL